MVEQNRTKDASPTAVLRNPNRRKAVSAYNPVMRWKNRYAKPDMDDELLNILGIFWCFIFYL